MDNEKLSEILVNVWDSLTDEQKAKAKACKTPDELIKLAGEEGIELPDEALNAVAGGYIFLNENNLYEIIDDETGKVLYTSHSDIDAVCSVLKKRFSGTSGRVINWDELQALRRGEKIGC